MKPIRVFYSLLGERFYASSQYRYEKKNGKETGIVVITGKKYDVTDDIARAVVKYDIEFTPIKAKKEP